MAPVEFGPNVKVNSTTGQNTEVVMAAHEPSGLIFVSWMGNRACTYAVSKDGGMTWTAGGTACASGSACIGGTCQPPSCPPDQAQCDGLCVDVMSDERHCGGCGTVCRPFFFWQSTCVNGVCEF
jgi:hypothetical protein